MIISFKSLKLTKIVCDSNRSLTLEGAAFNARIAVFANFWRLFCCLQEAETVDER